MCGLPTIGLFTRLLLKNKQRDMLLSGSRQLIAATRSTTVCLKNTRKVNWERGEKVASTKTRSVLAGQMGWLCII